MSGDRPEDGPASSRPAALDPPPASANAVGTVGRRTTRAEPRRWRRSRSYEPSGWHSHPHIGLGLVIGSTVGIVGVSFLGPSAVTLSLGPRYGSLLPPWYIPSTWGITLGDWPAVLITYLCIALGAIGMWILMKALGAGWRPVPKHLLRLGIALQVAVALVTPLTSADVMMYAAYGRLQVLGRNPYEITVGEIFRTQFDAVLRWTERPWQDTPSVYGPVVSASQVLANRLGGTSMHDVVFWLQVLCVVPMIVIGILAYRMAAGNPMLQSRAALFTLVNPAMLWAVTAQAHNEALAVMFAFAAIAAMRRRPWLAGLLIGIAGGAKVNMVLFGIAILWGYRREPRKLAVVAATAAVPLVICYGLWEPSALVSAARNTTYVNAGAWAGPVFGLLTQFFILTASKIIINVLGLILWVVVGWMLFRLLEIRPLPGLADHVVDPMKDPTSIAIRTAVVLYASWLITTPNSFSWYDLMAWTPLAIAAASRLDGLMLWRTTWLSAAFVTGRAIPYDYGLATFGARVRDTVCVIAQMLVLLAIVGWYVRSRREAARLRLGVGTGAG
jgi:alpha-1,6-mannosyltransferase